LGQDRAETLVRHGGQETENASEPTSSEVRSAPENPTGICETKIREQKPPGVFEGFPTKGRDHGPIGFGRVRIRRAGGLVPKDRYPRSPEVKAEVAP